MRALLLCGLLSISVVLRLSAQQSATTDVERITQVVQTMHDMRAIGTAVDAYAVDHDRYPQVGNLAELKATLVPTYLRDLPENDAWGQSFEYIVSADGKQYRIVSGGVGGEIEGRHRRIEPGRLMLSNDNWADLIYQEGDFIQVPNVMGLTLPRCPPPPAMPPQLQRPPDAVRAGGQVQPPRVIRRVEPQLPKVARQARVSGDVILDVLIDRDGTVSDAIVIKPLPFGLSQAAIDAVRQWRFEPATRNGDRVPVVMEVTMNFDAKTGKLE